METSRQALPEELLKHITKLSKAKYKATLEQELIDRVSSLSTKELKEKIKIYFELSPKISRFLCAKFILRKYRIMTDILTDQIRAYGEKQYYEKIGAEKIKAFLTQEIGINNSRNNSEEILHLIRTMTYTEEKDIQKARTKDMLPFINGVYDIKSKTLLSHDPNHLFDYQIPVIYNPGATCPIFEKFLSQVIKPENIPLVWDIFGLVLYPVNVLEKFFVLTGTGSNGKSVLINVLENFIGDENKAAISLKQMTEDKFSVAKMYKKLLNIGADISGEIIRDSSILKSASAKDSISGQFKFGQIFDFIPSATLVFSANTPPLFMDNSDGMNRRPELIAFPYKFGNDEDIKENPEIKKADPNLWQKLVKPDEMSGILNKALEHLPHILNCGQLSVVRSMNQSKLLYKKYSNSAIAFMEEFCEECPYVPFDRDSENGRAVIIPAEGFLLVSEVFPKYKEWCIQNQLQIKPKNSFSKSLDYMEDWNIEIGKKDRTETGHQERSIRGVKWKEE